MKKNIIISIAALALALSAAGCGQKTEADPAPADSAAQKTQQTDVSEAYSEKVDMDKVQGETAVSDSQADEYEGELAGAEVSIGDAKLISYEGDDVIVVSFDFKNGTDKLQSFTGMFDVAASQDDNFLHSATVFNVEGVELLSMGENVPAGGSIKVQMAYKVKDKSLPVKIEVKEFAQTEKSADPLIKEFKF